MDLQIDGKTLYYCDSAEQLCVLEAKMVSEPDLIVAVSPKENEDGYRIIWITEVTNLEIVN